MERNSISNNALLPSYWQDAQKVLTIPTPFIGREKELAKVADGLTNPACCLLTLIDVGGIGKTRLAI